MRTLVLLVALLGLAACGETEQVVVYKNGKYQGKPDTRSWDNEALPKEFGGAEWAKGDRADWERQLKVRQLTQNENTRIYPQ